MATGLHCWALLTQRKLKTSSLRMSFWLQIAMQKIALLQVAHLQKKAPLGCGLLRAVCQPGSVFFHRITDCNNARRNVKGCSRVSREVSPKNGKNKNVARRPLFKCVFLGQSSWGLSSAEHLPKIHVCLVPEKALQCCCSWACPSQARYAAKELRG